MPKQKYQHKLEHYCTVYGVSFRTIGRYSKLNYPLDDEKATRLLIGSQKYQPAPAHADAPPVRASAPVAAPKAVPAPLGLGGAIQRLQAAEADAHSAYTVALVEGDAILATAKQKQWLALSEQLRKVEQSTPAIEAENAKAINADELRVVLTELFHRLRQDLETLPKRLARELEGLDVIAIEQTLAREAEEITLSLFRLKYLEGGSNG